MALLDFGEMVHLWGINKLDFIVWWITFLFTMFLGVEVGIGVGVGVSLLVVLFRTAFPVVSTLGRIPETRTFRSRALFPGVTTTPGILVMKPESRIVFASVDHVREIILMQIKDNTIAGDPPSYLVLDLVAVSDIDATGVNWLKNFLPELERDYGITTLVGNPNRRLLVSLKRAGLVDIIGERNIHVNLRSAVAAAQQGLDESKRVSKLGQSNSKSDEVEAQVGPASV